MNPFDIDSQSLTESKPNLSKINKIYEICEKNDKECYVFIKQCMELLGKNCWNYKNFTDKLREYIKQHFICTIYFNHVTVSDPENQNYTSEIVFFQEANLNPIAYYGYDKEDYNLLKEICLNPNIIVKYMDIVTDVLIERYQEKLLLSSEDKRNKFSLVINMMCRLESNPTPLFWRSMASSFLERGYKVNVFMDSVNWNKLVPNEIVIIKNS